MSPASSGANNVIPHTARLILSPDARFLVQGDIVLPLDGTETFRYIERAGGSRYVAVSPNGRYIAVGWDTVWLQPVSPETLRPNGAARKLLDLRGGRLVRGASDQPLYWTRDSQTVFFRALDAEGRFHQYAFSAATGAPVSYPDAASTGLPAPDGKCVALTLTEPRGGFWVKPMGHGAARMLCEQGPNPMCWSQDGQWLIGIRSMNDPGEGVRFVRYPEGREYFISWPMECESNSVLCVGPSADRSKLFFYQGSTKLTWGVRVASAEAAALSELDAGPSYTWKSFQWAPDGRTVFHQASTEQGQDSRQSETGLFASSFSGDKPVPFTLQPAVPAGATLLSVSPDGKWLLFTSARESGRSTVDLNVIPLSVADHKASGPATVVFRITPPASGSSLTPVWSPDSTRAALTCKADPADDEDTWIVFTDGRTPIRLTRTAGGDWDRKWSPDGSMLAFLSDHAGVRELKVVPTAGGEAAVIRKCAVADTPLWGLWGWSPDSKSLTIAEEGVLVRQPLSGGKAEPIANLKELGIERLEWQGWSPDGSRLALACPGRKGNAEAPLASWGQLVFARVEGGRLQETGATDMGPATWTGRYAWSPDGTHVACEYEGLVAMRPEGRLYAVAVDDVVARIEAGVIPPTRPKAAIPAVTETESESQPAPEPEPITGSVFSDNFDSGLSKCWQIVPMNPKASPPPAHAVENGQLMLVMSRACLKQIDWANYLVTVRVCMREGGPGAGSAGIFARATPSDFGIKGIDGYVFFVSTATSSSGLAFNYSNASGVRYGAALGRSPCTLVQGKWYKLAFEVRGEHLRGYLDDKLVIETTDARLSKGPVAISAATPVLFDDFSVRRLP